VRRWWNPSEACSVLRICGGAFCVVNMATAEHGTGGSRPRWRLVTACSVALVLLLLAGWALFAPDAGLAWPYPQRLPEQVSYGGFEYQANHDCRTRYAWLYPYRDEGGRMVSIGSVPSALIFGGPQMYGIIGVHVKADPGAHQTMFFVLTDRGCLTSYGITQGEP
jgi:hypothetical protein